MNSTKKRTGSLFEEVGQELFLAAAGHLDRTAVFHDDAPSPSLKVFLDPLNINDVGIMDPEKDSSRKQFLVFLDIPGRHDRLALMQINEGVGPFCFQTDDLGERNE